MSTWWMFLTPSRSTHNSVVSPQYDNLQPVFDPSTAYSAPVTELKVVFCHAG